MALRRRANGMTLLEVTIVTAIVGILSAVAFAVYTRYVETAPIAQAQGGLSQLANQVEQYAQDHDTYSGACTTIPQVNSFVLSCPNLSKTGYLLEAQGTGTLAGLTFTLDDKGDRSTPSAPSGWTANLSCWISDQQGDCAKG